MTTQYDNPRAQVRKRFIDLLKEEGVLHTEYAAAEPDDFDHLPVFVTDNIYEEVDALFGRYQTIEDFIDGEVKTAQVPFAEFFIEHIDPDGDIGGTRVWALRGWDDLSPDISEQFEYDLDLEESIQRSLDSLSNKWTIVGADYRRIKGITFGPLGFFVVGLNAKGKVTNTNLMSISRLESIRDSVTASLVFSLYFLGLLSALNLTTEEVLPPPKIQKSRTKKGKKRLSKYITIRMRPSTRKATTGESAKSTRKIRQRRGHLKTYTESRPLFGKYVGTWYWGPVIKEPEKPIGYLTKNFTR